MRQQAMAVAAAMVGILIGGLVSPALGQTVPDAWQSLDGAGLRDLALQFRAQGTAGEASLNQLAAYVATRYSAEAAAGPINWQGPWLDLAWLLGQRYSGDTRAAMAGSLKQGLAPDAAAVAALSEAQAAKLLLAINAVSTEATVLPTLTADAQSTWVNKVKSGLTASGGPLGQVNPADATALVYWLWQHQDEAGASSLLSAWLANPDVQGRLAGMDLQPLVPQLGLEWKSQQVFQGLVTALDPLLAAQHARQPLSANTCQGMAWRWQALKDAGKAKDWALRAYQARLGTAEAKAAATEQDLQELMYMSQLAEAGGAVDQAKQMITDIEPLLLAKGPQTMESCTVMITRQSTLMNNPVKAADWAVRAYPLALANPALKSGQSNLPLLREMLNMANLMADGNRSDDYYRLMNNLDPLLVAENLRAPFDLDTYQVVTMVWRWGSLSKAQEWAQRAYQTLLGTDQAKASADAKTVARLVEMMKDVELADKQASASDVLTAMAQAGAITDPVEWRARRDMAYLCIDKGDLKKAQDWAQQAYQLALGTDQARALADESTLLELAAMLYRVRLSGIEGGYPEYTSTLINLAKAGQLTSTAWTKGDLFLPDGSPAAVAAVRAELVDGAGMPRLALARVLSWTYLQQGTLPAWKSFLDQQLAKPDLTADQKAYWLMARAFAGSLSQLPASPIGLSAEWVPMAGKQWLDQALATAQSASVRLQAVEELVGCYRQIHRESVAVGVLQSLQGQFTDAQLARVQALITQLQQEAAKAAAAAQQKQAASDVTQKQALLAYYQRRLQVMQAEGKTQEAAKLQAAITALQQQLQQP